MKLSQDLYHGQSYDTDFFEGWYFKLVDASKTHVIAFIPGIFKSPDGNQHCFLQVLNLIDKTSDYIRFLPEAFYSNPRRLKININQNTFSCDKICVDLHAPNNQIHGILYLNKPTKWPNSKLNPGRMGFYNHFNFMECYSHVCALDGVIEQGHFKINGQTYDFSQGKYYIEKTWGSTFPQSFIKVQSNSFIDNRATLTCALATLAFPLIKSFRGFSIGLTVDNSFYHFSTTNGAKLDLKFQNNEMILVTKHPPYQLTLQTKINPDDFILCHGPKQGEMTSFVHESLTSEVVLKLENFKTESLIYEGIGYGVGLEYAGDLNELMN